ncbi:MAG: LemA family protein [Gammaproteobacteria bacterium]|jgi:LemA protein
MINTIVWILPLLLPLIWAVFSYNRLVRYKNMVLAAWSDISVQLKRRHDLIPKLVDAVQAYSGYERSLLNEVTRLRTDSETADNPTEKADLELGLTGHIKSLIAVAEAYPDLKADSQYLHLLHQLTEVENNIQFARRYYNGAVQLLNVRIDSFPDVLIARTLGFRPADFFELESASEALPPEIGT